MGYWRAVTSPKLWSVAVGVVLIFAVLVAQAQEPIALQSEPGGKGWKNVYGLCFSSDSRWLAAGVHDRIVVWDVSTRETAANLPVPRVSVTSLAFSPDGLTCSAVPTRRADELAAGPVCSAADAVGAAPCAVRSMGRMRKTRVISCR